RTLWKNAIQAPRSDDPEVRVRKNLEHSSERIQEDQPALTLEFVANEYNTSGLVIPLYELCGFQIWRGSDRSDTIWFDAVVLHQGRFDKLAGWKNKRRVLIYGSLRGVPAVGSDRRSKINSRALVELAKFYGTVAEYRIWHIGRPIRIEPCTNLENDVGLRGSLPYVSCSSPGPAVKNP